MIIFFNLFGGEKRKRTVFSINKGQIIINVALKYQTKAIWDHCFLGTN